MRFTIAQIEAFFWTAQLGSLSKAAGRLHIAQPTISLRLKDLERALDVTLFQRSGRGLTLTPEGSFLVPRAAALLEEADRIMLQTDPDAMTLLDLVASGSSDGSGETAPVTRHLLGQRLMNR